MSGERQDGKLGAKEALDGELYIHKLVVYKNIVVSLVYLISISLILRIQIIAIVKWNQLQFTQNVFNL